MRRILSILTTVALLGCGDQGNGPQPPGPGELIPQSYQVSECGGFEVLSRGDFAPTGYCDAEVLSWSHDAASGTLKLRDNRVELNCCGERAMSLEEQSDGSYEIRVTDAPEALGGRCHCMCVFDFSMEAKSIAGGVIQVKLLREVTDGAGGAVQIWSGQLDLSQGAGEVVVDSAPSFWCGL